MLLVIIDPISPAIHLGPLSIRWYGVGYAVASWSAAGWRSAISPGAASLAT